ncbi:hypothetical protein D3C72_1100380 [compost metagenome]
MAIKKYAYAIAAMLLTQASGAFAAIVIEAPASNAVIDKSRLSVEVNGSCPKGMIMKVNATDSANKATVPVWTQCQSWGYSVQVDISGLKDGKIKLLVIQDAKRRPQSTTKTIVKNTAVVVTPPVVTPPVVTPPVVTPPVSSSGIIFGVNGHDGRTYYPMSEAEARFKILDARNLRSYRFDIDPRNFDVLDQLVVLAKKYNIILRPMAYPISTDAALLQDVAYKMAKRYANDIKVWELGNEQDYDIAGAQARINNLVAMYKGVKKASDELGANIKTTINIMACNDDDRSATARCPGDKNGAIWFLDKAKASGFNFDHISFHYYAYYSDKGYWMDKFLYQARAASVKYNTKIFFNETNCADVYQGNTDGGFPGDKACYDSVVQLLNEVKTKYADVISEVNMYELLNEPDNGGVEKHFGLMYNINSPKPNLEAVTNAAKK